MDAAKSDRVNRSQGVSIVPPPSHPRRRTLEVPLFLGIRRILFQRDQIITSPEGGNGEDRGSERPGRNDGLSPCHPLGIHLEYHQFPVLVDHDHIEPAVPVEIACREPVQETNLSGGRIGNPGVSPGIIGPVETEGGTGNGKKPDTSFGVHEPQRKTLGG